MWKSVFDHSDSYGYENPVQRYEYNETTLQI